MKDDLDLLFSRRDEDIERISEKYQAVGKKKKEQIYKISKRKYDILKNQELSDGDFTVEASGVERYRRPRMYSALCAAAAAVVLVGGISGTYLYSKSNRPDKPSDATSSGITTEIAVTESSLNIEMDPVVDELEENLRHIMKARYTDGADYENGCAVSFLFDSIDPETNEMYKKEKKYFRVTDEKLDTLEKMSALLRSTFTDKLCSYYEGSDLSKYADGYDFGDDSLAVKNLKPFITYNGLVLSELMDYEGSYDYKFAELYDFSSYKMVSSDYSDDISSFECYFADHDIYSAYADESTGSLICSRVYHVPNSDNIYAYFLLKQIGGTWKISDYSVIDDSERIRRMREHLNMDNVETTTASEQEVEECFAELQLHSMMKFDSDDEVERYIDDIREKYINQPTEFKKVDTERYIQQIFGASNYEEYNSLENKSYIYHVMLNSKFYFDTAEGKAESDLGNYEFSIDNRSRRYYSRTDEMTRYEGGWTNSSYELYTDNDFSGYIDLNSKKYEAWTLSDEEIQWYEANIPDNDRVVAFDDETGTNYVPGPYGEPSIGLDYLLIQSFYPDSCLCDFSSWSIDGTGVILGRKCAHITMKSGGDTIIMYVDLETGIILRKSINRPDSDDTQYVNITEIKLNEPVKVKEFDATGYTPET
ncbi:MAG: hypothetical protein J6U00_12850 [Ruminococcus sp.]|uniref:hypothetical protein n=1 Tax=Ruminococcus sp. TaxID=41978 RepID=UPI001B250863|nr:hypothetical protein [Ruminococcus sp.]MBO7474861.1 hypothetical protein [Ruminococcus sp.]